MLDMGRVHERQCRAGAAERHRRADGTKFFSTGDAPNAVMRRERRQSKKLRIASIPTLSSMGGRHFLPPGKTDSDVQDHAAARQSVVDAFVTAQSAAPGTGARAGTGEPAAQAGTPRAVRVQSFNGCGRTPGSARASSLRPLRRADRLPAPIPRRARHRRSRASRGRLRGVVPSASPSRPSPDERRTRGCRWSGIRRSWRLSRTLRCLPV
ncbi:hypothetical protein BDI4_10216 [Burkholderia diffusa]|nr:hypothetical protein BDI4_10216 [Burkholderia diffusa]